MGRMKYPYTFTAKIAQFPYKFYVQNNWVAKFYLIGCVLTLPIYWKIHKLANCPENKRAWAEIRRREAAEHAHHH